MAPTDEIIRRKFSAIEQRLKNAFSAVKTDISQIINAAEKRKKPTENELKEAEILANEILKLRSLFTARTKSIESVAAFAFEAVKKELGEKLPQFREAEFLETEIILKKLATKKDIEAFSARIKGKISEEIESKLAETRKLNEVLLKKLSEKDTAIKEITHQVCLLRIRLGRITRLPIAREPEEITREPIEITLEPEIEEIWEFKPTIVKIAQIAICMIPMIFLAYVAYANFVSFQSFETFYDIGSLEDAKKPFLSPLNRISGIINESEGYRNLTLNSLYFNVQIPTGSDRISVDLAFKNNFPMLSQLQLGAKDKEEWHYFYKTLFSPVLEGLSGFDSGGDKMTRIYRINQNLPVIANLSDMPEGSVIATNLNIQPEQNRFSLSGKSLKISTPLRGGHTFKVYINGPFSIEVQKQDLNWYEGKDPLIIRLEDSSGKLIKTKYVPDDGITAVQPKPSAQIQTGTMETNTLPEGVYTLKFSDFDGLIREMTLSTDRIITNKLFLAGWDGYVKGIQKPSRIYIRAKEKSAISFRTYHNSSFQNITINNENLQISQLSTINYDANKGEYIVNSNKNDIIISSQSYISFSKNSYFEPLRYSVKKIPGNFSQLVSGTDYVVTDYTPVRPEGSWLVGSAWFELKNLYIKDNKLSMLINAPHLGKNETAQYQVPVDWINMTVEKDGIF